MLLVYGPQDWKEVSSHCTENAQSPIDIEDSAVEKNANLKGLSFKCDNKFGKVSGKLTNNGHAPTLSIDKPKGTASLTGGPLGEGVYKLEQLHFHFGCENDEGSEHTVNGRTFSGEVWEHLRIVPRRSPPAHSTRLGAKCRDVTE